MKVVITIPAHNEEKTIGRVLADIKRVMGKTKYKYKMSVVDDGSTDNTVKVAKSAGATVHSHPMRYGLSETFKTEMQRCIELKADVIVHIDADGQYKAEDIPRLLKEVEAGNDLVLGSRFKGKIEHMPILKRFGNKAFSKVISGVCRVKISDGQTGFRAFTKKVAKEINIISGHTYTQEQIIKAIQQKFKIKEIPIYFARRKGGKSRLMKNPFEYALRAWVNLIRIYRDYQPLRFFGMFGGLFLLFGLLIGLWFVYLHFTTGIKGHLGMIFLMLLLITTGVQITLFGFLADMNKK